VPPLEAPQRLNRVVDPLSRHHSSQLKQDLVVRVQSEPRPGQRLADRPELALVEATGNGGDPGRFGVVQADEVLLVLGALGDQVVRLLHHTVLDGEALVGKPVGAALVGPPDPAEGVEGDDERGPDLALDLGSHQRRHPEVGVDQVVAPSTAAALQYLGGELPHEGQQLLLGHRLGRSGIDVDDPDAVGPGGDVGQQTAVPPGEDVHPVAEDRKLPGQVRDVLVLAARVDASELPERGRVFADQGDAVGPPALLQWPGENLTGG
jgi:hypothetical protein